MKNRSPEIQVGQESSKVSVAPVAGENRYIGKLMSEFGERVAAAAARFASPVVGTADIAQEVWMVALTAFRLGDVPRDPGPWLAGVARNVGKQLARDQDRRRGILDRYLATVETVTDGEPDLDEKRRRDVLREAIDMLPEPSREIVLCRLRKMSVKETARTVGCPEGTVKSCYHRASEALIRQLREAHDAGRPMNPERRANTNQSAASLQPAATS